MKAFHTVLRTQATMINFLLIFDYTFHYGRFAEGSAVSTSVG